MANRRLTYQIGITADTTQFQAAIQGAMTSLSNIGTSPQLTKELQQASLAALELANNLNKAINQDTGSLDLRAFNDSLKKSGQTLSSYYDQLVQLGPAGQQAFLQVASAITQAQLPIKQTNALLDKLWVTMKNTMRWQLTSSMLHGFVGSVQTAYGYAKNLNESLNNIRIVTNKSADDMAVFAKRANEAAKALNTTTTDYTDASLIYYQQGLTDEEVEGRAETTIKMANVSRQAAEEVSEQLTAIWNNFYDGTQSLDYYADVMVALGAATASSSDEIATGLQKFAAVAGTVGLSYEYAASALATLTSNTRESASVVGTALRTLFTRFQGLSLGETLEDGTDLNKYSKALAKVGIQILDTNGNLKQMDTILDDTADKWESLSQAQQMALAQTVAGVRQYTQFISLMENWGDFQDNLAIATGSSGALDEQADIYAESWEAARDRVRAAAEDIYDSLVNDEFYIAADNALTPLLSGIATTIDAVGGLSGVLTIASAAMMSLYGDKMAQGMRDMVSQIGFIVGYEQVKTRLMQQQAAALVDEIAGLDQAHQLERDMMNMRHQANIELDNLNDYQKQILQSDIDDLEILKQQISTLRQRGQEAQSIATSATQLVANTADRGNARLNPITTNTRAEGTVITDAFANYQNASGIITRERTAVQALAEEYQRAAMEAGRLDVIMHRFDQNNQGIRQTREDVRAMGDEFEETARGVDLFTANISKSDRVAIMERAVTQLEAAMRILRNEIEARGGDVSQLDVIDRQVQAMSRSYAAAGVAQDSFRTGIEQVSNAIVTQGYRIQTLTDRIVKWGQYLSQASMALTAFQSLGRVFTDEDMTAGQRAITIFTSLSMIIPLVGNATKGLTAALTAQNAAEEIQAVLAGQKQVKDIKNIALRLAATNALKQQTAQTNQHTASLTAEQIAQNAVNASLLTYLGYAALALAGVAALTAVIYLVVKAYNADADAAKKAAEESEKLTERYNEVKNAYEALKSSLENYQSAKDGLDELVRGTDEWKEAVSELNQQVLELLDSYPELAKYVSNNKGVLEISEEGQEEFLAAREARVRDSYQASLLGSSRANATQQTSLETDFKRETAIWRVSGETAYQEQLSTKAIETLRDAINNQGEGILENSEALIEATNFSEEWANQIISNRDATLDLINSTNNLIQSNDILAQQIGHSILEDQRLSNDERAEQLAKIAGEKAQELYLDEYYDEYKDKIGGKTDKDIQQEYANLMGYQWVDNLSGNKGKYLVNGEAQEIDDATARAALAQQAAKEAAVQDIEVYKDALHELSGMLSEGSDEAQDALANLGVGVKDFSDLTAGEIEELQNLDFNNLSQSTLDALGVTADELGIMVEDAADSFNEAKGKIGDDYARSVQEAINGLMDDGAFDDLSLSEMQDVADIFALASAYGKLDEAIAAYEAGSLEEFAEGIKEVVSSLESFQTKYAAIREVMDGIATGDTISKEDYDILGEGAKQYFTMMLDGTYKLTANAAEFKEATQQALLDEATKNMDTLELQNQEYRNLQGYDFNNLTKQANYQDENGDWKYDRTTVQQQLDIIRLLGDQTDETKMKLDEWYQDLAAGSFDDGLDEIAQMVGECSGAFNGLSDTIAANEAEARAWNLAIASSYDNLDDLKQALDDGIISTEAYTQAAINLDRASDTEMLDPEEWEDFADYLRTSADEMEGLNDEMSDNEARIVAKGIMKMNDAIEDLSNNFEDWSDIIQNSSEDSEEFAEAMQDCRTAVANLLDVSEDYVSNDFISQNLELIEQAATGSATAIDELKSKLGNDIIARIVVENGLSEDETATILADYQNLVALIPDIDVGVSLDDGEFLTKAQQLIADAGMTVDQVNALFDAMGFEANFKTEPVLTKQRVPEYVTETIDAGTYEDENGNTVIRTRTRTYQDGYYEAEGYIDAIAMTTNGKTPVIDGITKKATGSYNNYSSKNAGGGSPGGGGSSKPKQIDKEEGSAEPERYHRINRVIEAQERELEEVGTQIDRAYGSNKLALFTKREQELNTQLANQNVKLEEANEWLKEDQKALQDFLSTGGNDVAIFDEDGEIANFDRLQANELAYYEASLNAYNAYIETYNAMSATKQEAAADELEAQQAAFEAAEERWTQWQDFVSQYEDTLDIVNEQQQILLDGLRELSDLKLQEIDYKLEIVLDIKSMKDSIDEFWKEFYETQGDYLSHFKMYEKLSVDLAGREANMFGDYVEKWQGLQEMLSDPYVDEEAVMEDIQELQSQILDSAAAIVEWADSIEEIIPEAVSAAADRFAKFTDQLDHNTSVLETIKELYALQGVTNKTASGFATLQRNLGERLEAQTANAVLNKKWADEARQRLAQAQAELDAYLAAGGQEGTNEHDRLLKARDAYLEEFNEAQEAYLSLAQEAMETAQEMYLEQIERAVYEFGQAASNGLGLDLLQDKYDHYIEAEQRYLDKVNEAYQVTSWYNKLQKDIDEATSASTRERFKTLQEEINLRREGGKLSQYDLEILEAKYRVMQAQIALEDAQNAKNNLQLVRDRQGNWNYQYTADPGQVEQAEQDLITAQNEWYNIAKEQVTNVTGEIVGLWQECSDAVAEIYNDMTLTDQERADRAAEIYAYYTDKIKYLEEEKQVAVSDMTEAGNESLLTNAILMGDTISDLTSLTSEEIQKIVEDSGGSIIDILSGNNKTIEDIVASNTGLIDLFENKYAEDLGLMTGNTETFETDLRGLLEQCQGNFQGYQDKVEDVARETGTTLGDLADETIIVSDATDELRSRGEEAAVVLWGQVDAAAALSAELSLLAEQYLAVAQAMAQLAAEQAAQVEQSYVEDNTPEVPENIPVETPETPQNEPGGAGTGGAMSANQMSQLVYDMGLGIYDNNPVRRQQVESMYPGMYSVAQSILNDAIREDNWNYNHNGAKWRDTIDRLVQEAGFATGGYTGEFDNARLAFLHEKELVLNQEDTNNILAAVNAVRMLGPEFFAAIERALDSSVAAGMGLMKERIGGSSSIQPVGDTLQQEVHIEAVFPNATDRNEIAEALSNLSNDASQYIRRRRD